MSWKTVRITGQTTTILVSDPDLISRILIDSEASLKSSLSREARLLTGDGTATTHFSDAYEKSDDRLNSWRLQKRSLFAKALAGTRKEQEASLQFFADACSAHWADGEVIDIYASAHALFFEMALERFFSCAMTPQLRAANAAIRESASIVNRHLRAGSLPDFFDRVYGDNTQTLHFPTNETFALLMARRTALQLVVDAVLAESVNRTDSIAIELVQSSIATGFKETCLREDIIGFILASYENSATTAAWLVWNLALHDEWQQMSRTPQGVPMHFPRQVTGRNTVLWYCLMETLRLYPPVWSVARKAISSFSLTSAKIEAGASILISPWLQHHSWQFWPDPEKFEPLRFADRNVYKSYGIFLPFGLGSHLCPAELFALSSISSVVKRWLEHWRFTPSNHHSPPAPTLGLIQQPRNGVWVRLEALH